MLGKSGRKQNLVNKMLNS